MYGIKCQAWKERTLAQHVYGCDVTPLHYGALELECVYTVLLGYIYIYY